MTDYDQAYRSKAAYFGAEANRFLLDHLGSIRPGGKVLDIGVGQGRNALPLAERGFAVTGIDASAAAIEATAQLATQHGLSLALEQTSLLDHRPMGSPYDGVLLFGLLQELTREVHQQLWRALDRWTAPGSCLFLTAWHIGDPRYEQHTRESSLIGEHSFRTSTGAVRTYLEHDEICTLLPGWDLIHHFEGLGPWHRHDEGEPERHGLIELVAKRGAATSSSAS